MTKPWLKKMWWVPIAFMVGALLVANVGGLLLTVTDRQVAQAVERKASSEATYKKNSEEAAADCTVGNGCVGQGDPEKYALPAPVVQASLVEPIDWNEPKPAAKKQAWMPNVIENGRVNRSVAIGGSGATILLSGTVVAFACRR